MKVLPRLVAGVAICLMGFMPFANGEQATQVQSYAGHLLTPLEFSAALTLWTKESGMRVDARNGSHYGLCQGRSKYMATANYRQQVRWCISYAQHRYGTMVKALAHWRQHGWH